jgi:DNA-binding NtrC family response regulator
VGVEGLSILIVEDDPALRLVCRVNLELEQYRVREADSVETARMAVSAERPSLVFLDLHLGKSLADGTGPSDELLDELTSAAIPVVLVSGTFDVAGYKGRAAGVLPKPFDPVDLVDMARRCAVADVRDSASLDT